MKRSAYFIAVLMSLAGLQACSEKTVNAPAAVLVPAPATAPVAAAAPPAASAPAAAEPAEAPPVPMARSATLLCQDRRIDLQGTCTSIDGERALTCTQQILTVMDSGSGKLLSERDFSDGKAANGEPAAIIDAFGEISCVTTKSNEKFIVATMGNGGNCEICEWVDVYTWDGALLGSSRARQKTPKGVDEAVAAAFDEKNPPMAKMALTDFYFLPMED